MRIDAERVIAIIQELVMQVARRDQQMIEPGLGQCRVAALRERGHVLGKQRVQIGVMDIHDASGKQAAIVPRQPAHGERWWMRCAYPPYNSGFGFRRVDKRSASTEQRRIGLRRVDKRSASTKPAASTHPPIGLLQAQPPYLCGLGISPRRFMPTTRNET